MRKWHIKLHNTLETRHPAGIWKICCWVHLLAWINRSCIAIHKALVLDRSLQYVQCLTYAAVLHIFLLFSMISYCRIQSRAVSKRQEVRWCSFCWSIPYQLTMFGFRVLIGLFRLLHTHIVYETDSTKIIALLCRISRCLHDLIWLNSIVCHVQTTRSTMIWFSMIDSDINWLCLKRVYWYVYLAYLILILHMK